MEPNSHRDELARYHNGVMKGFGVELLENSDFQNAIKLLNSSSKDNIFNDVNITYKLWYILKADNDARKFIPQHIFEELNLLNSYQA